MSAESVSTSSVDKARLMSGDRRPGREWVTVPGVGDVLVRGLTRSEVLLVQELDVQWRRECRSLHYALVDPRMTETEVERWMRTAPSGEFNAVAQRVLELSGMAETSAKEETKSTAD